MKSKILFLLLPFLALIFWQGCKSDPCEGVACINGVCSEGECECETGWKGADCSTYDCDALCDHGTCYDDICYCNGAYVGEHCETCGVAKFYGTYHSTETCDGIWATRLVSIADNGCDRVFDFDDCLYPPTIDNITAIVATDMLHFTLNGYDQYAGGGTFGEGVINAAGTEITGTFHYTDNQGTVHNCALLMTKQ